MHASIGQLLNLRDGEPPDAATREHIAACGSCSAELARLHGIRDRLQRLPTDPPVQGQRGWANIEQRLSRQARVTRRRVMVGKSAAAASLGVLAVVATVRYLGPGAAPDWSLTSSALRPESGAAAPQPDSLRDLRARSEQLEEFLGALPARPAVERAETSLPIETLESQVQWLDQQLSLAEIEGEPLHRTEQLWRHRVEVMDSLVRLRYVEAQRLSL
jgi:hypothetical protein